MILKRCFAVVIAASTATIVLAAVAAADPSQATAKMTSKSTKSAALPEIETQQQGPAGSGRGKGGKGGSQSIIVLVNDEPITAYEIEQRQKLMSSGSDIGRRAAEKFNAMIKAESTTVRLKEILAETIKANEGKSREQVLAAFENRKKQFALNMQQQAVESARAAVLPTLRQAAIDELIDDRLKLQEAKRLNVVAEEEEVNKIMRGIADRNKMTEPEFKQHLKKIGADANAMRDRFRVQLSWNELIRRRFGSRITISDREVDRYVAAAPGSGDDQVEMQLQRVSLPFAGKLDQKQVTQRLSEAETILHKRGGCQSLAANAAGVAGAKFEDLGVKKAAMIPEPTRSLLLNASDGDILPPSVGETGVELWALCGRKVVKADDQKRSAAQGELRQKEFEILARRQLKDLRQDASIEYR